MRMPSVSHVQQAPSVPGSSRSQRKIGNWRLVKLLGEGNWSQVYQAAPATCTHSTADYVLKTLRPELETDPLAHEMLRREAQIGSSIRHPNLASVLAARVQGPPSYLVMPYMAGVNVRETLEVAGRLRTPHALWIARQTTSALAALHRSGWLHGDVKPANIFVATSGHTTLIDFGMARRLPLSGQHRFAGTPAYAAPEWFTTAGGPGPWSDIYSLGLSLQAMLTGQPAAGERSDGQGASADSFPEWLPSGVVRLLQRVLSTDPLCRPTAHELIGLLVELEIETLGERDLAPAR